jgi:energy-coupling factor transporter ATP-binding protein EcfA2
MRIHLTLKNYRCFPDRHPATIEIRNGFAAFLGVNNSGKSSILRFFHEFRDLFAQLSQPNFLHHAVQGQSPAFQYRSLLDPSEVFHSLNDRPIQITLKVTSDAASAPPSGSTRQIEIEVPRNSNTCKLLSVTPVGAGSILPERSLSAADGVLRRGGTEVSDLRPYLSAAALLQSTFYIGAFRNILNTGTNDNYFDIRVGEAFVQQWREMQTGSTKANNAVISDVVRVIERLFGYQRLEIQAASSGRTLQVLVDGHPHKLHELGSGIAQFILVLANAAMVRPDLILIDEPELNLHPSLQIDFLTTLTSYAKVGTMFATHSIGLARAVADRIYSVQRLKDGVSQVQQYERTLNLAEFLGSLGFSSYQQLGFDKVLLVEGVTEVQTIQQFLRLLKKDHQIVMLPLGGGQMISGKSAAALEELKRITPNLFALIDSERSRAEDTLCADRETFRTACAAANIRCHVLDRRATENYLSESAIQRIKGPKYRALGHYEKLESLPLGWGKGENWRIAREMSLDDLAGTDLRGFLDSL